ncbi:MAG: 50S ribosomal protein L18 [Candidatus Omnitrophica bacterium]|nr:50S ribosomal protein L18 [Candidatus Omnitrophota bacterium]
MRTNISETKRIYRHQRIRRGMVGTPERPRLCIHRSLKNISASLIDDTTRKVLMGVTTLAKDVKAQIKTGGNVKAAEILGGAFAKEAIAKGYKKVAFDRGGYLYHGRVKAFAEAARKEGLEF